MVKSRIISADTEHPVKFNLWQNLLKSSGADQPQR
jgi:hypothetical protein